MYSVYNLKVSENKLATQISNIPISQQPDSFVMVYIPQGNLSTKILICATPLF